MKKFTIIFSIVSVVFILFFQNLSAQKSTRMVLLEQFTNASCTPCANTNPSIITLHNNNPSTMALIYYHVNWPGASDPMYLANPTEISSRVRKYTVSSVPKSVMDGDVLASAANQTSLNSHAAVSSPFTVQVFHEIVGGIITVEMIVTKTAATTGTLTAQIAVIEEQMVYGTAPGTNGETTFHNVFKKFLPNYYGTTINNLNVGESQTITKSWTYTNVMDPANLRAVAFIQDNSTKDVLQSGISSPKSNIVPVADFVANTTFPCITEVKFLDNSSYVTSWIWDFGDGSTSNLQNPLHTYNASGTYTVQLIVSNTNGGDTVLKTNFIVTDMPVAPVGTDGYGDAGNSIALSATGSDTLKWYTAATGGAAIYTGTTYNTPLLYVTTDYYVDNSITDAVQKVGMVNKTINGGNYTGTTTRGELFDVYKPCLIKSIKLYANSTGVRIIEVTKGIGGPVVHTKTTASLPTGEQRVTLDFQMEPGIDYFLNCRKASNSVIALWRDTLNATYPHTVNGTISITGSDYAGAGPYWYFLYDWEVQGGPCVSPRTKVTAHVNVGVNEKDKFSGFKLFPNPTTGEFTLNFNSPQNDNITLDVFDINNKLIYSEKFQTKRETSRNYDFSSFSKGVYFLRVVTNQKVYNEKLVID
ncbi:MAG: PKD domain-containing protein [Bacteroidales bacterium]|nr:PKD domain-containing protein [Bacteroidales bacterium]